MGRGLENKGSGGKKAGGDRENKGDGRKKVGRDREGGEGDMTWLGASIPIIVGVHFNVLPCSTQKH